MGGLSIVFGATLLAFLLVVIFMAVGVMMGRREISGSCGGLGQQSDQDGQVSCSLCSNPDAACRELGKRAENKNTHEKTASEATSASQASDANDLSATNPGSCEQMDAGRRC